MLGLLLFSSCCPQNLPGEKEGIVGWISVSDYFVKDDEPFSGYAIHSVIQYLNHIKPSTKSNEKFGRNS